MWRGTTDRDGIALAPALPLRPPDNWHELSFIVTAEKDGDFAYVASDWNEGIMPWEFDVPFQLWESTDILRGSVFTDRGVYKPGEPIHVKAIVRSDTPNGMRLLPAGSALDVRVHDSRNREVDRRTITINRWSSAEWTWTVPADATLGNYRIQAMLPGIGTAAGQRRHPATPSRRMAEAGPRIVSRRGVSHARTSGWTRRSAPSPPIAGATLQRDGRARVISSAARWRGGR